MARTSTLLVTAGLVLAVGLSASAVTMSSSSICSGTDSGFGTVSVCEPTYLTAGIAVAVGAGLVALVLAVLRTSSTGGRRGRRAFGASAA